MSNNPLCRQTKNHSALKHRILKCMDVFGDVVMVLVVHNNDDNYMVKNKRDIGKEEEKRKRKLFLLYTLLLSL